MKIDINKSHKELINDFNARYVDYHIDSGKSIKQIAEFAEVNRCTVYKYMKMIKERESDVK